MKTVKEVSELTGIIPRALVLIAVGAIFTMLSARTANMLSNLMGAEEQKEMLDHMNRMKDNAVDTSETLFGMVNELAQITESLADIVEQIRVLSQKLNSVVKG